MSLFSALLPPATEVESLRAELDRLGAGGDALRWEPPERWHVTLGFYGDSDDLEARARWLRARLAGQPAPTVCLESAGAFPGVLWAGVRGDGLAELGAAAGAGLDDREFRAHLTLARSRAGVPGHWPRRLAGYRGMPWTVAEVVLMRSERGHYTVVERFPLGGDRGC